MKRVRITVMKMARYDDLIEKYENPIEHPCDLLPGQVFIADGWKKPEGLCDSAWETMSQFVLTLSCGGEDIYEGWMKNKKSAMISCNDGFRPVSFYLEALDDDGDEAREKNERQCANDKSDAGNEDEAREKNDGQCANDKSDAGNEDEAREKNDGDVVNKKSYAHNESEAHEGKEMPDRSGEYVFYGHQNSDVPAVSAEYPGIRTPKDLYDMLSEVWCAETCPPRMRSDWTPENKTLGQCSITAFLAQDIFGGKVYGILRPGGNYHCYNDVNDKVFDLTSEQFLGEKLSYEDNPEQFREVHFAAKEEKRLRYELLKKKLRDFCLERNNVKK